jgi:pyruvate,water dikinase
MSLKYKSLNCSERDFEVRFISETLRELGDKATESLRLLSDLKADLNHTGSFSPAVKRPVRKLIEDSLLMSQALNLITNNKHQALYNVLYRIKTGTEKLFEEKKKGDFPIFAEFGDTFSLDSRVSGSKGYWISKLKTVFSNNIPPGFIVTTKGYDVFLRQSELNEKIKLLCSKPSDLNDQDKAHTISLRIRNLIENSKLPEDMENEIIKSAEKITGGREVKWVVRASVSDEVGDHSFAGQFENLTEVENKDLPDAYKKVISGKFGYQALMYRAVSGYSEIRTPMAVVFMPMLSMRIKGNVKTADFNYLQENITIINYTFLESNEELTASFTFLDEKPKLFTSVTQKNDISRMESELLYQIAVMAGEAKQETGSDLDIDWCVNDSGDIFFLQARKIVLNRRESWDQPGRVDTNLITSSGKTLFPGRADGNLKVLKSRKDIENVKEGSVILIDKPEDYLVPVLPLAAAVIIIDSDPFDPILSLIKDLSIPSVYQVGAKEAATLYYKNLISVDATKRRIYNGIRWPRIRERVNARIKNRTMTKGESPLYHYVLNLNLRSPDSPTFKAKLCGSVHDVIWYIQEISTRTIFEFGDYQKRKKGSKSIKLKTDLPLNLKVIDLDLSCVANDKRAFPENIKSELFQALWEGVSDTDLFWPPRWEKKMVDMPVEFSEIVLGGSKGPRRKNDYNYLLLSKDYLNLNARISYHYTMVDAVVRPGFDKNHIHFRFWDGGGSFEARTLCACFLERVLLHHGFGVERNGDVINSWYRFYPEEDTMNKLVMIGRLIVCARELDAVLNTQRDVKLYSDYFINRDYSIFS